MHLKEEKKRSVKKRKMKNEYRIEEKKRKSGLSTS
jgi:hypothetical protein